MKTISALVVSACLAHSAILAADKQPAPILAAASPALTLHPDGSTVIARGAFPGPACEWKPQSYVVYPWSFFYRGVLYPSLLKNYQEEIQAKFVPFKIDPQTANGVAEELDLGPYAKESDCPDVIMCCDVGPAVAFAFPYLTDRLPPAIHNLGGRAYTKIGGRMGPCVAEPLRDAIRARGAKEYLYVHEPKLYHEFNWYRYDEFKAFFDKHLQPEHKHE